LAVGVGASEQNGGVAVVVAVAISGSVVSLDRPVDKVDERVDAGEEEDEDVLGARVSAVVVL
jgi:hypothetical protein